MPLSDEQKGTDGLSTAFSFFVKITVENKSTLNGAGYPPSFSRADPPLARLVSHRRERASQILSAFLSLYFLLVSCSMSLLSLSLSLSSGNSQSCARSDLFVFSDGLCQITLWFHVTFLDNQKRSKGGNRMPPSSHFASPFLHMRW